MQIKLIKQHSHTLFPKRMFGEHREVRLRSPKWRQVILVVMAALAAPLFLSCRGSTAQAIQPDGVSAVAPVFEHGEGLGSFGCAGINPLAFITEYEARQLITEEARKAGIEFEADVLSVGSLDMPGTDRYGFVRHPAPARKVEEPKDESETRTCPRSARSAKIAVIKLVRNLDAPITEVVLDGTDRRLGISYEYVSQDDYRQWEKRYSSLVFSTTRSYDFRSAAANLRESLVRRNAHGIYAVFYDPMSRQFEFGLPDGKMPSRSPKSTQQLIDERRQQIEDVEERNREELRKQVRDFVQWLKAEGII